MKPNKTTLSQKFEPVSSSGALPLSQLNIFRAKLVALTQGLYKHDSALQCPPYYHFIKMITTQPLQTWLVYAIENHRN